MHDSGERQQFETGAVRDTDTDKPRPELISPFALWRLAEWYREGAKKYEDRNWEKGTPISRVVAALFRHLLKYMMGRGDEDHMAAVAWNAFAIMHYEEMIARDRLPETLSDWPYKEISKDSPLIMPNTKYQVVNGQRKKAQ